MDTSSTSNGEFQSEDEQNLTDNPEHADGGHVAVQTASSKLSWKKIALVVGGAAVTAAGSVVATLAATHKTAVFENMKAYGNGINDALEAIRNGFDPFE
jgi:hypothetical protein